MIKLSIGGRGKLVWAGRPSVSVFYALYGVVSLVIIGVLAGLELWFSNYTNIGSNIFPQNFVMGGTSIPYPIEIATAILVLLVYIGQAVH